MKSLRTIATTLWFRRCFAFQPESPGIGLMDPATVEYARTHSEPIPNYLTDLVEQTKKLFPTSYGMMISSLQGQFMQALVHATKAIRILEIGCFTGSSALWMSRGFQDPDNSLLVTLEIDPKAAELANYYFKRISHGKNIHLILDDAIKAYADKSGYISYYNFIMDNGLLDQHGLLLADNVLFRGQVVGEQRSSGHVESLRKFNDHIMHDNRVQKMLLPVFDGLMLVWHAKKA